MDDDVKTVCGLGLVTIIVVIVFIGILATGSFAWWYVYDQPLVNNAFNSEVQGLVTEYCTAPRAADQEAAKTQLVTLANGNPNNFSNLPGPLKKEAQAVENDQRSACP